MLLSIALVSLIGPAQANADTYVRGYYRSNGTYVQPHYRSSPDSSVTNNYSYCGNTNPYTGTTGTQGCGSGSSSYSLPSYTAPSYVTPTPISYPSIQVPSYTPYTYTPLAIPTHTPYVYTPPAAPTYEPPIVAPPSNNTESHDTTNNTYVTAQLVADLGNNHLLVLDGQEAFFDITYHGCLSTNFNKGESLHFNQAQGYFLAGNVTAYDRCSIGEAKKLNLFKYALSDVILASSQVVLEDANGQKWISTYYEGCSSLALYKGHDVVVNVDENGSDDRIILVQEKETCLFSKAQLYNPELATTDIPLPTTSSEFLDVHDDTPFAPAIRFLQNRGIVAGLSDGTFHPNNFLTRAELLKMVLLAKQDNGIGESYSSSCFSDVDATTWYARFVCYAKENQIIGGYDDGTFKPGQPVSYVEALKITLNILGHTPSTTTNPWYDAFLTKTDEVKAGVADTKLNDPLTRGKMAELITRIIKYDEEGPNSSYLTGYQPLKSSVLQPIVSAAPESVSTSKVPSSTYYTPESATALCNDGTYSFSANRQGSCSHHDGVAQWL